MNCPESASRFVKIIQEPLSHKASAQVRQMARVSQNKGCAGTRIWCAATSRISFASEKDEIMLCWKHDEHC